MKMQTMMKNSGMFWHKMIAETHMSLTAQTIPNNFGTPQFTTEMLADHVTDLRQAAETTEKSVVNIFAGQVAAGQTVAFEKRVIVVTSRDYDTQEALTQATQTLSQKQAEKSFEELKTEQAAGWAKRWEKADVEISGNAESQQGIRFNLFQLFSTYYGDDARLNIGPKRFHR